MHKVRLVFSLRKALKRRVVRRKNLIHVKAYNVAFMVSDVDNKEWNILLVDFRNTYLIILFTKLDSVCQKYNVLYILDITISNSILPWNEYANNVMFILLNLIIIYSKTLLHLIPLAPNKTYVFCNILKYFLGIKI